jgi:hypothetical protein
MYWLNGEMGFQCVIIQFILINLKYTFKKDYQVPSSLRSPEWSNKVHIYMNDKIRW